MLGTLLDDGHMTNTCQEGVQQGLNATLQDILGLQPAWKFWYWDPQHFNHSLSVLKMCYKALPDEDCQRVG